MTLSRDTFIAFFPDFESEDESRVNLFITEAARYVNSRIWSTKTDFATALYTAHLLSVTNSGASSGSLSEDKVGDLSQKYSTPTSEESLGSTAYGLQFLQMRKSLLISPMVIR